MEKMSSMQGMIQELLSVGNNAKANAEELKGLLNLGDEFPTAVAAVQMGIAHVDENKAQRGIATMLWIRFVLLPAMLKKAAENMSSVTLNFWPECDFDVLKEFLAAKSSTRESIDTKDGSAVAEYRATEENGRVRVSWTGYNC